MKKYKDEWLGNIKGDLLAGLVVCMALIPEAIGFSIVAGVDPMIGVYASFTMSVMTAVFGGRPGMISAAAGSMALVLAGLVRDYGIQYMLLATIITGIFQMILGYLKVGRLLKFIPRPVMIGFVNALGIMMFKSQLPYFQGSFLLIPLGLIGVAVVYLFPKLTKAIPSPIIAIILVTIIVAIFKLDLETLGDMGRITTELPSFSLPDVPLTLETLRIVLPYSLSLSIVGLVESLLTAQLVDDLTDTSSNKNQECIGQGIGNITTGFFGGIAGCGMIGQTVINQNYGGRGRLSTFSAGVFMLIAVIVFNNLVIRIPVVALGAVMVTVAISTFSWNSLVRVRKVPLTDTIVMISTVAVVLLTDNLAYGVLVGVLLSSIFFTSKSSQIEYEKLVSNDRITYMISGQLYFASSLDFIDIFDYNKGSEEVFIDLGGCKILDESAVDAIDKVIIKFHRNGRKVKLININSEYEEVVKRLSEHIRICGFSAF